MKIDLQLIADAMRLTKRSIEIRANREAWVFEEERVRGGRRKVFVLGNLPDDIARAVTKHQAITSRAASSTHVMRMLADLEAKDAAARTVKQAKGEANLKKLMAPLPAAVQSRFDGRYAIVKSFERWFPTVQPMGKKAGYWAYADAFNAGETDIAAAVREQFQPLKGRAVEAWVLTHEKDGMAGLIDRWDGKAKKDVNVFTLNPKLEDITIALLMARPNISMKTLTDMLAQAAIDQETGEVLFEVPSYWATTRFCNAWKKKNAELRTASANPDEWKNKYMVAFGDASEDVKRLNQRWEMDATPADWMLQDDDGALRRYSVSVVIDVYSSRSLMVVSPTPRAETHKLALRLAILKWGVPEVVVTDNGKDYVSKDFLNTLAMLEIAHHRTNPFSPWEKPFVERMNQTMLHSVMEVYSSFIGHNVAERNAIEARNTFAERLFAKDKTAIDIAMPAALLQSRINQWLTGVYEQRPHGGAHMDGMSPFAKAAAYRGEVRRIEDERALDVLLAPPAGKGNYVVTKKGLNIQGAQFIALQLSIMVGQSVQVYLTDDFGQIVVYHEGQFVCIARCPERTGISRQEVASHARQLQRKNITELRKRAKAAKLDPDALVSSFLQEKAEKAGKLAALPNVATTHTTTALYAASEAARTLDGDIAVTDVPSNLQVIMNKRQAERNTPVEAVTPEQKNIAVIPESPQLRFRKWLELDELVTHGGTIDDPKLTKWYGSYPQTAEHASMYKRHQETSAASDAQNTAGTVVRQFKTNQ